ncbi:DUF192 domain-containing protein [Terrihabitans sp. B22-R8]|uniref:DUF192 domain-containing protein n=1 Tax=Terrihabitans sp. B22-R8 TaxID=3425128 RepID=UPI00403C969E
MMRFVAALLVCVCLWAGQFVPAIAADFSPLTARTESGAHEFQVEIANTDRSREQGLMYRRDLADDRGMLFDFEEEREVSFWMQNTYISLDMIFIRSDGVVQRVEHRATPLSTRLVDSGSPVRFVLEVPGGISERLGIKRGTRVEHALIGRGR